MADEPESMDSPDVDFEPTIEESILASGGHIQSAWEPDDAEVK